MANQSKTPFEAKIDLAELVDFWRFNAYYLQFLYAQQPDQAPGEINRFDWRPLEGFVLAIPPFNFYSIGGNLATAPAMVGNVVLWKPARSVLLANYRIMQVLQEAGLPEGVINFVPFARQYSDVMLEHPAHTSTRTTPTRTPCGSATPPRPMGSRAPSSPMIAGRSPRLNPSCAMPQGTSTSMTSRPGPSWRGSPSAARGIQGRTTRPGPGST